LALLQVVLHAVLSQAYAPQEVVTAGVQPPLPSQAEAVVCKPLAQEAAVQPLEASA
jgi:hypothetical protein